MMKSRYLVLAGMIILLAANCTKPYTPKAITSANNYLVVEGVINTGISDQTFIKLSRTVPLNSGAGTTPETGAAITIQGDDNQSYSLNETTAGTYVSDYLTLDISRKYRLNINTADGKNYISDYVASIQTPFIDSIGFTIKSDGLQIYANTHNPQNNTRYYRWDYIETWVFHAKYFSSYITNGQTDVVPRTSSQLIYQCWGSGISNNIILGSSAKLSQDIIYQNPITFIPSSSEKIESRYSILLKQYGLSAAGYNYFQQLKQNTEQLGGVFDPQPSQLTGNVHCTTDASIPAIGYVTVGTIQQKRVFIDNSQLPTWTTTYPYDCTQDTAYYYNPKTKLNEVLLFLVPNAGLIVTSGIYKPGSQSPIGYLYTTPDCGDCSIRGTTVEPSFWQ